MQVKAIGLVPGKDERGEILAHLPLVYENLLMIRVEQSGNTVGVV